MAERDEAYISEKEKRFEYLMPLPEVIAASLGISSSGDKAEQVYCAAFKAGGGGGNPASARSVISRRPAARG
ncbi:MAG: hypothetical protein ACLRSW_01865 [Christensenellaceae bacterium]